MENIAIIGAGAWGTALAMVARRAGRNVVLQAHEPEVAAAINGSHENSLFLPGMALDPEIRATNDPAEAVVDADAVLLAVPTQFLRAVLTGLLGYLPSAAPVVICAKGIEQGTLALMSEICEKVVPQAPVAVLSGPTFAAEVALNQPTAVTLASADEALGEFAKATGGEVEVASAEGFDGLALEHEEVNETTTLRRDGTIATDVATETHHGTLGVTVDGSRKRTDAKVGTTIGEC